MRAASALLLLLCATAFAQEPVIGVNRYSLPHYPVIARQAMVQGDVVVDLQLDIAGNVTSATARSGHQMLRDAAIKAIRDWRFVCASCSVNQPLQAWQITFRFALDGSPSDLPSEWYSFNFPGFVTIHTNRARCWAYVSDVSVTKRPWYLLWIGRHKIVSRGGDIPCDYLPEGTSDSVKLN